MIRTARFRNFKALRDVRVDLEPLTVIVGPNASGKTSILQGLQYLAFLGFERPSLLFRGVDHPIFLRSAGTAEPLLFGLGGLWGEQEGRVKLLFTSEVDDGTGRQDWTYEIAGTWGGSAFQGAGSLTEADLPSEEQRKLSADYSRFLVQQASLLRRIAYRSSFLRLEPSRLARASYSDQPVPYMDIDGSGLASVLAHLKLTETEQFNALEDAFKEVIPGVRKIRIDRAAVRRTEKESAVPNGEAPSRATEREVWGHRFALDMDGSPNTLAEAVSEGTLLVLGLLTSLMSGGDRTLVLLDDLDRGLHSKAMGTLVAQLRAVQAQRPGLQILATTHSPYLIDQFKAEEVRLTALRPDGSAVIGSLPDHPEFPRWKDAMLPGEFWSTIGEKWLTERENPAHASG